MTCMAASEDEALSKISEAENALYSAYDAVLKAEEAGANVTLLLGSLDEAGELLSKAHLAYNMGDFDSAFDFAVRSQTELDGFPTRANNLVETATQLNYLDFVFTVVYPIAGAVFVVFGGIVVWLFLKAKYERTEDVV